MDQQRREEELQELGESSKQRLEQVKQRMNRYFLALEKAIFSKSRIPLPDESGKD